MEGWMVKINFGTKRCSSSGCRSRCGQTLSAHRMDHAKAGHRTSPPCGNLPTAASWWWPGWWKGWYWLLGGGDDEVSAEVLEDLVR